MRTVLFGLAGGAAIVALSGEALASPSLANTCYDVGLVCANAGPDGNQHGTCEAATCVDLLDASYACGIREAADAGQADGGGPNHTADSGASSTTILDAEAPGVDAASLDAASVADAAQADAAPAEGDSSPGSSEAGSGDSSGDDADPPSGGGSPGAAPVPPPPMPGCSAAPSSRTGPPAFALLALGLAILGRVRRRRE